MKTTLIAVALLCVSAIGANAQSFTFSGTGQVVNQVMPVMDGRPTGGVYSTGAGTTVMGGKKLAAESQCMQWTLAPGGLMTGEGVCTVSDTMGTFNVGFQCQGDAKTNSADCWARVTGSGGGYANKLGTASWHSADSADHKSLTYAGAGQWNN